MIESKLSVSYAMKSGFGLWKKHFLKIMIVGLIVYIPTQICIELISIPLNNTLLADDDSSSIRLANNIYELIRYLIGAVALLGILNFVIIKLEDEDKEELTVKEILISGFNKWSTFIGAGIIAGFKILGYTLLLIIPGIYKSIRLSFIDCIVVTNSNKFKDECDESEELVKNHWWEVFGFYTLLFVLQFTLEIALTIPFLYGIIDSEIILAFVAVFISLIETYFIVVRAHYFVRLRQLKNESAAIEQTVENAGLSNH